ncbi:hypothetical protein AAG584_05975 [Vreelandella titanicae]|uniref:hypothetical protein n=1 Tax=Vreelandella titanicae TaxID=664683 RepID=UPI00315B2593
MRFDSLKKVDLEEAVNNLDRAFEGKLEAFHSLYDVTKDKYDYFSHADTALLILLRNAVHHRNHLLFRSWNSEMLMNDGLKRNHGNRFLLVEHEVVDASIVMRFYYKLEDFYLRLDQSLGSPFIESKMKMSNRETLLKQINEELYFNDIAKNEDQEIFPNDRIYINMLPIFISATCKVFKALKSNGVEFKGFDAKVYERPFTEELNVDLSKFVYRAITVVSS